MRHTVSQASGLQVLPGLSQVHPLPRLHGLSGDDLLSGHIHQERRKLACRVQQGPCRSVCCVCGQISVFCTLGMVQVCALCTCRLVLCLHDVHAGLCYVCVVYMQVCVMSVLCTRRSVLSLCCVRAGLCYVCVMYMQVCVMFA